MVRSVVPQYITSSDIMASLPSAGCLYHGHDFISRVCWGRRYIQQFQ